MIFNFIYLSRALYYRMIAIVLPCTGPWRGHLAGFYYLVGLTCQNNYHIVVDIEAIYQTRDQNDLLYRSEIESIHT